MTEVATHPLLKRLTPKQIQILELLSKDWTYKRIAEELKLSRWTVYEYARVAFAILDCRTSHGAVGMAIRLGILD